MCKKDDRLSHQNSIKFHIFTAIKAVGLFKALKDLLQRIYQMLGLLYHKHNHLITTVLDENILKKIFTT